MNHYQNKKSNSNNKRSWIYGKHAVFAALFNQNRECFSLYIGEKYKNELQKIKQQHPGIKIYDFNEKSLPIKLDKDINYQSILLEASHLPKYSLEEIIEQNKNQDIQSVVILDQVTDPHNIGAILRSAAAFGVTCLILPENNSPKEYSTIMKISSGASEIVPIIKVNNLVNAINLLKENDFWIVGLDGESRTQLHEFDLPKKTAFVMGSEGKGIRKLVAENTDIIVKIPINNIESLNVSNASAISFYEFYKKYFS